MELSVITVWLRVLLRELYANKRLVLLVYAVISLSILTLGLFWPKTFESKGLIYADRQNIIQPLLEGSAEVTNIDPNELRVVRELIYSPKIIEAVVKRTGEPEDFSTPERLEVSANRIRASLVVAQQRQEYIRIAFKDANAAKAYRVVSSVIENFISSNAETKRRESKEAYQFIDRQVKSYKTQLQQAENRLKEFNSTNLDGTTETVNSRIADLRTKIEEIKLDLQEAVARRNEVRSQLQKQSRYVAKSYKSDVYRERLLQAQSELDNLRLSYEDTYPDIVALKHQIADLRKAFDDTQNSEAAEASDAGINPLYDELRSRLAEIEVDVRTRSKRLEATEALLAEEYKRAKRIAAHQAELAELNRDYDVTRGIYEDMLERKEKARLSMTLDVEGQGVSYKIQDPPAYPLIPVGLRFVHFVLVGLVVGGLIAVGVIVAYVIVDPRIRFDSGMPEELEHLYLGTVPHMSTSISERMKRKDIILAMLAFVLITATYVGIVVLKYIGVL